MSSWNLEQRGTQDDAQYLPVGILHQDNLRYMPPEIEMKRGIRGMADALNARQWRRMELYGEIESGFGVLISSPSSAQLRTFGDRR